LNSASRFSAIIFDCDGVLVDSEVLALEVEMKALAEIDLSYDGGEFRARFMGMSNTAFFNALEADHRLKHGRDLPPGFREMCHARYQAEWHRLTEIFGAKAAVERVTLPKAVASSSTRDALARKLRHTDLWPLFAPHIYSADHVAHAKPAPDLFLYAADALRIAPTRCLVLEDSANGIAAARAAGMTVWGFTGGGHMDETTGARLLAAGAERLLPDWQTAGEALAFLR
jgi:beta-phosphoglucomutase-like phosphatase (HAD superfamily)